MLRKKLHDRGIHRFCRVVPVPRRVRVGTDYGPRYFEGTDPKTGETTRIDATTFGGDPIYRTVLVREHR